MKTGIEMVQDGFTLINVNAVTSLITGIVCLFERPKNSDKTDVVLNTLALTSAQLQQGVFNVNVHCPNINGLVINGSTDSTQPDIQKMLQVGNAIINILKDYNGQDYKLDVQTPGLPLRDSDGTWYLNIRVNYFAFQTDYSNI